MRISGADSIDLFHLPRRKHFVAFQRPDAIKKSLATQNLVHAGDAPCKAVASLSGKAYEPILRPQYRWDKWAMPRKKDGDLMPGQVVAGSEKRSSESVPRVRTTSGKPHSFGIGDNERRRVCRVDIGNRSGHCIMIGKLTSVPLRNVWKHEALDFTVWLEKNIEVLSDVLDLKSN